jgi:hypothetical protein
MLKLTYSFIASDLGWKKSKKRLSQRIKKVCRLKVRLTYLEVRIKAQGHLQCNLIAIQFKR